MIETPVPLEVRVRYAETDKMGVVYHTNYLVWFEIGRTELLRMRGSTYRELEERGVYLPVLEASCRYLRPAVYDDVIRIETTCERVKRVQLRFHYRLVRPADGAVLAEGSTLHVATDADGTPCRLPRDVLDRLQIPVAVKEGGAA